MLHDKFPTTAFVYIDGHPFSNHSAAAVHYLVYQVDRMYSVVKISHFPSMYIIYNIHAVAILWFNPITVLVIFIFEHQIYNFENRLDKPIELFLWVLRTE